MDIRRDTREGCAGAALLWTSIVLALGDTIAYMLIIRGLGDAPPDMTASVDFVAGTLTWHSGGCNGVTNGNP
ncbi:MAG: hypothetical protein M3003_11535 [Candidatus Dormibacteraeota bacterium]|nr:hypothetical protein [Candidatus Dormibacteraeota bacterium]